MEAEDQREEVDGDGRTFYSALNLKGTPGEDSRCPENREKVHISI